MIICDEVGRVFTLHTRNTTYQLKADRFGVLLHTYYGPRIRGGDMSRLIRPIAPAFSPNPDDAFPDRAYSLDTLPQEYSGAGAGDLRLPAIELELADGSHVAELRYTGFELRPGKYVLEGLPAFFGNEEEAQTLAVFLEDKTAQVSVELLYGVFEKEDLITRAVRVVNRGDSIVLLRRAASLCLDFPRANMDLITFDGGHVKERSLSRGAIRPGVQSVGSVRGISSPHHNPFVILCDHSADEEHGVCYGAMLLYSGNFEAACERDQCDTLRLTMGIHPFHFCFALAPGESFTAPEAALVCSPRGFGKMSRQFHRAIRAHLLRDPWRGEPKPVLVNSWEATWFQFDLERLLNLAREASSLGIGLFVLDDGWFGYRNDDTTSLGDWLVNEKKLPGGLKRLSQELGKLHMGFGLWIEPEMVSEDSELFRAHPDWVLKAPNRPQIRGRCQLVLDFSRPDVREHIFEMLRQTLEGVDIAYIKWDMNRCLTQVWSAALPADRQGEVYHRYVLGVYDLLERFRKTWPHLLIEGCSSGGGRFDAGMLYYTPQIWCSDNTDAVDRLTIQYGTSFAYPPCTMGAHVADVPSVYNGHITPFETRGIVAMSGAFGYELDLCAISEEEKALVRQQIREYYDDYELIHDGDYFRLSAPGNPFTAWAHVSPDKQEAIVSIVAGQNRAAAPARLLKLRGLDPALSYRVGEEETLWPGDVLMLAGYPLPWLGEYHSLRLRLRAVL